MLKYRDLKINSADYSSLYHVKIPRSQTKTPDAHGRARYILWILKQVAINVKLRNFTNICLALCLADKKKAQRFSAKLLILVVSRAGFEPATH